MRSFKQPSQTFNPYDAGAPRVQPDTSTPALATAVRIEDGIRRDALETGVFIGLDGAVLLRRQGLLSTIDYGSDELKGLRNTTFTHNHPGGATFSVADVALASEFSFFELRVVTGQFRHRAVNLPNQTFDRWQKAYDSEQAWVVKALGEKVRTGQLHHRDFGFEVQHFIWHQLAKRFSFFYGRERS